MTALLEHGHTFDLQTESLESCSDGGLFSNFYHTLWSIIDLHNQGVVVRDITFNAGNTMFRDSSVGDLFPRLFALDTEQLSKWEQIRSRVGSLPRLDHHGVYALYPHTIMQVLIRTYFNPSHEVSEITRVMNHKYQLSESQFAALYYRGTDKHTEVTLADPEYMIHTLKSEMQTLGLKRCLIQTDDADVLALGLKNINGAFYMDELPVTNRAEGFHFQNAEQQIIEPLLFAQRLSAMTHVLASANLAALPVSNLAGWVSLLRGNTDGIVQFNKHGKLVTSSYQTRFRIKNTLRWARCKLTNAPYYYV